MNVKQLLKGLPIVIMLIVTLSVSSYWINNKPTAKRQTDTRVIPLVAVIPTEVIDFTITIKAMGQVVPAKQINLTSRINGMVTSVSPHFVPGDFLEKGEQIVQLDQTDYRLLVKQKQNELEKAQFNFILEQGQQAIAQREFKLLNMDLDAQSKRLVLREPHLALAKSAVIAAEAALTQANLDLKRTKTVSPFNAIILETNANIGSWVSTFSTGTPLVKLAGIDYFWVIVGLSLDYLNKIDIPNHHSDQGAEVTVHHKAAWGDKVFRIGRVKRLKAELEPLGRLAELIIEVEDPLNKKISHIDSPPLILGAFVQVNIKGHTLKNVIALPDSVVHNGTQVWLLNDDNLLEIKTITSLWRENKQIFIDANELPDNSRLIQSNLSAPVEGMLLRTQAKHND